MEALSQRFSQLPGKPPIPQLEAEFDNVLEQFNYPPFPGGTFLTSFIRYFYNKCPVTRRYIGILFSYPVLMVLVGCLNLFSIPPFHHKVAVMLLLSGVVLEVFLLTTSRVVYGPIDSFFFSYSAQHIETKRKLPFRKRQNVAYFALLFSVNFFIMVFSFGSIYHSVSGGIFHGNSLGQNVANHYTNRWNSIIDTMYFSMLTLCTVGYGDVIPYGPVARGITMIQMSMGFLFFILLLAVFASSMEPYEVLREDQVS